MKKLIMGLILSVFISNNVFAGIDESQTDLYYANGMLMELSELVAEGAWKDRVEDLKQYKPKEFKKLNAKIAYNSSALAGLDDRTETLLQWMEEKNLTIAWATVQDSVPWYLEEILALRAVVASIAKKRIMPIVSHILGIPEGSDVLTFVDFDKQVEAYKESIESGHGVIVVAHGQGNFFTNKAYIELDSWMRPYFNVVAVGSPAFIAARHGPRVSYDNDIMASFSGIPSTILNRNRARKTVTDNRRTTIIDLPSFAYHPFEYYMGEAITVTDLEQKITVSEHFAISKIIESIFFYVNEQASNPSQWKKDSDVGCLCSDKSIDVVHKFDTDLNSKMDGVEVFAFDEGGKLYPVAGRHVLAQLGGESMESGEGNDVCYVLRDEVLVELGSISGAGDISGAPGGLFTAQLRWEQGDVRLRMSNSLMGDSASGCGVTALGSGSKTLYDVKPGTYPITVTAEGQEDLKDDVFSDMVRLNVSVPGKSSQSQRLITSSNGYSGLGTVADILITRPKPNRPPKVDFIPSLPTVGGPSGGYGYSRPYYGCGSDGCGAGAGVWYGGYSGGGGSSGLLQTTNYAPNSNPDLCTWKDKIGSCGNTQRCLPCEFDILHHLNQAKLG